MATVYLDHIIPRESLRYIDNAYNPEESQVDSASRTDFRLRDLSEDWFQRLRKPDFQRETNSWSPEECVDFLDSLVNKLVIPGIIIWRSDDSGLLFVIDGAHRLSVIRAWMLDDWGENNNKCYNNLFQDEIQKTADQTRRHVQHEIGSFIDHIAASNVCKKLIEAGKAPKLEMPPRQFSQSKFYNYIQEGAPIPTQWIHGTYEAAEKSFLKINKGGQKLNKFEQSLIEFRNGPYARIAMSIINKGNSGHYWPDKDLDDTLSGIVNGFDELSSTIHNILFVPPFDGDIVDLNQPLVMSKPTQQYEDALELLALVSENKFLNSDDSKKELLQQLADAQAPIIIDNANTILKLVLDRLSQLLGDNINNKSLSIVPAIYTYNHQGIYSKNLLYAFIYWLFCKKDQIQNKKLALSAIRGKFEAILIEYKSSITNIASTKGGNFKSTKEIASIINSIICRLVHNINNGIEGKESLDNVAEHFGFHKSQTKINKSRVASKTQKNQINLEQLYENSTRCQICHGVINLKLGKQYDHFFKKYSEIKQTSIDNMKPVHPFCNNMKAKIEEIKSGKIQIPLQETIIADRHSAQNAFQLSLFNI
jgi:hypothetical protein